jgi:predicted hydrocarbon binding protein
MNTIPESGYYNSNKFARIFLESIQEITGKNGLNSILNYAKLPDLINNMPPDNLERAFDFAHFAAINQALEDIYGDRGGRGLALRIGRNTFDDVLKDYGEIAGVLAPEFKVLPVQKKILLGLQSMAKVFTDKSDQITAVSEEEDHILYQVERCPVCWGRERQQNPACYYMVGLLKEGLYWVSGGKEFDVIEKKCIAQGENVCEFIIPKKPSSD